MSKNQDNSPENNKLAGRQGGENPFSLPENYFSSFSQKMMLKIELADELKEFKLLSAIDKKSPFVTPDHYFAQSSLSTEVKIELTPYEKLVELKKINSFITPESYFETSASQIENRIEWAEELNLYPALNTIERSNGFAVPQGYFETFSHTVREKIFAEKNKTGIFDNVIHIVFSKRTAYALAAMLVLSLGLYIYNAKEVVVSNDCNTLACLDRKDILKDNQLLPMDDESLMEMVNVENLSKNLNESLDKDAKGKDTETSSAEKEDYVIENVDVNDIVDEI